MLTHIGTNTIETERLILRKFEYSDNASMRKNWIADKKIQSLYREPVYTTESEVKDLLDMIYTGKMTDAKTIAAILAYAQKEGIR